MLHESRDRLTCREQESAAIKREEKVLDTCKWQCITTLVKFPNSQLYKEAKDRGILEDVLAGTVHIDGVEREVIPGNIFLNAGINNVLWPRICGSTTPPALDNANARIGVGDGTTPASPTQTDLQGTNKLFKGMDAGFPSYGTAQKAVFRSTFLDNEANWTWNEWGVSNGQTLINRKVEHRGLKVGGIWVITVELILS